MPTYQYACTACGHQLEAVQSFTDDALTECPACAGRLRKLFSSVGIVFKGSGFYRTDSRSGNGSSPDGAAAEGAGKSGTESKSPAEVKSGGDTGSSSAKSGEGSSSSASSETSKGAAAETSKGAAAGKVASAA